MSVRRSRQKKGKKNDYIPWKTAFTLWYEYCEITVRIVGVSYIIYREKNYFKKIVQKVGAPTNHSRVNVDRSIDDEPSEIANTLSITATYQWTTTNESII